MREGASKLDVLKISAVADYLLGRGAGRALLRGGEVEVVRSSKTGRVREVYVDGVLVATFRASDGFLLPTVEGARKLLSSGVRVKVVVVSDDAAEFVARGRSVFAKHVVDASPDIRAGDEVVVVNKGGEVLAVGRAKLSGCEMVGAGRGVAVKVRRGAVEGA